jgi:hypothetical protein
MLFASSAGVRPERELYRFPACSVEDKDDCGYACTFSCAFLARTDGDFFSYSKYEGIT